MAGSMELAGETLDEVLRVLDVLDMLGVAEREVVSGFWARIAWET
jgi:hypothetical protein